MRITHYVSRIAIPATTVAAFTLASTLFSAASSAQEMTWTERVTSPSPTARDGNAIAFDRARGRMVLFGGGDLSGTPLSDTWEWDGTVWTQQFPSTRPSGRNAVSMVYDVARSRVVLFGGGLQPGTFLASDETWEWDGTTWTERAPVTRPPGRFDHGMAYDEARERVVLFGGVGQGRVYTSDTWEWDGTTWTERFPSSHPSPRNSPMAYDAARGRTVLFGGDLGRSTYDNDETWEWDGTNWIQRFPTNRPPARAFHGLAYDASGQRVVLFGGTSRWGTRPFADTWAWDGNEWVEITPSTNPPPRWYHKIAYDTARQRVVLFGGAYENFPTEPQRHYGDTWELHPAGPVIPSTYTVFGTGCEGPAGMPILTPSTNWGPRIGDPFTVGLLSLPTGILNVPFGLLGTSNTEWGGVNLPLDLSFMGMQGCTLYVSIDAAFRLPSEGGTASWTLPIPNMPSLVGLNFYQQGMVLDFASGGVAFTNAGEGTIGQVGTDPRLLFWNTLGSDQELRTSIVGPPVTALQTPAQYVPTGGSRGGGLLSDNERHVASIPSAALSPDRGTLCLWVKLINVPAYFPNATEQIFVHMPISPPAHVPTDLHFGFTANDGLANSGWLAGMWNVTYRTYSIGSFGTTSTASLGSAGEAVHIAMLWDRDGLPESPGERVAVFRNGVKVSNYLEIPGPAWGSSWSVPYLLLNYGFYNPTYASGPVDLDLAYDDLKVYNVALETNELRQLYESER